MTNSFALNKLRLLIGSSMSGKTRMIRHMLTQHLSNGDFEFGIVFCPHTQHYEWLPKHAVVARYNETVLTTFMTQLRQFQAKHKYFPNSFIVFDDSMSGVKQKSPLFTELISTGRNLNITVFITVQYIKDVAPLVREQAGYAFIFSQETDDAIIGTFKAYGGLLRNKHRWEQFLSRYTPPYQCVVFIYDSPKEVRKRYKYYKAPEWEHDEEFTF